MNIVAYLNIPYRHRGRDIRTGLDCYGLVKEIYRRERGIVLPDYVYDRDWAKQGLDLIREKYWAHFKPVETAKIYTVATFRDLVLKTDAHLGVMIGGMSFLHVPENGVSRVDHLGNRVWHRAFSGFYDYMADGGV